MSEPSGGRDPVQEHVVAFLIGVGFGAALMLLTMLYFLGNP